MIGNLLGKNLNSKSVATGEEGLLLKKEFITQDITSSTFTGYLLVYNE